MRTIVSLITGLLVISPLRAGDPAAERHAKAVAPFVDSQTFFVGHVDVTRIDMDVVAKHLKVLNDSTKKSMAELLAKSRSLGCKDIYVLMNWLNPFDDPLLVVPLGKDVAPQPLAEFIKQVSGCQTEVKDQVLLAGSMKTLTRFKDFKAEAIPEFAKAFAAVGEGSGQVVFVAPTVLKRALVESFPVLPKEIGGGSSAPVLDFQWAAGQVDLGESFAAKIVVQATDAKGAQELGKIVGHVLDAAGTNKEITRAFPNFDKVKGALTPKVEADRLTLSLNDSFLTTVLLPAIQQQKEAAERVTSQNNLKQFALAMHNYHDAHKTFPPAASYDANGKPLLSWRVHILPYIDEEKLYKEFRLNEPWDSEHNKKLIARMPAIYRSPEQKNGADGKTTYLVPVGPKTIFEGKEGMKINKILDGTSNTLLIVEADDSRAVYWTQPEDYKIDEKNPAAGLFRKGANGFNAAFADGSVRVLPATIDPATLRALYTASGGEVIGPID